MDYYYWYLLIPLCSAYQEVILSSHMSEVIWYWSITWKYNARKSIIQNYIILRQDQINLHWQWEYILLFVALIHYGFSSGCYSTCNRLHNFLNRMPLCIICIPSPGQTKTPWVYYLLFLSDRQCNTSVQTKHQRQNTMCTNPLR